jgi:hypothetical protein
MIKDWLWILNINPAMNITPACVHVCPHLVHFACQGCCPLGCDTVQLGTRTKNLEHTAQPAPSTPTMEAAGSCKMLVLVCDLIIGNCVNWICNVVLHYSTFYSNYQLWTRDTKVPQGYTRYLINCWTYIKRTWRLLTNSLCSIFCTRKT